VKADWKVWLLVVGWAVAVGLAFWLLVAPPAGPAVRPFPTTMGAAGAGGR
jgi:hypothetical protein